MRFPRLSGKFPIGGVILCVALLSYALAPELRGPAPRGTVVAVADGDTLEVADGNGSRRRVRLYGVDSPELHQTGGQAAVAFTESLVEGEAVELTVMDTDQYSRDVVVVTLPDGRVLNGELVGAGHAWVYRRYCKTPQCAVWDRLEAQARREKAGLWGKPRPEPPWKWRGRHPRQDR